MTMARTWALGAVAAALLAACSTPPEKPAFVTAEPESGSAVTKPAIPGEAPAHEAKFVSLPFRLDLTFSDTALAKLQSAEAALGVSANYYGAPKTPDAPGLDPDLGVWLGGEMETIDPSQRSVTFRGQVDAARVAREVKGDARVRVTVFPVRAVSGPANVTCAAFDEYLSIAVETGGTVHCTLKGK